MTRQSTSTARRFGSPSVGSTSRTGRLIPSPISTMSASTLSATTRAKARASHISRVSPSSKSTCATAVTARPRRNKRVRERGYLSLPVVAMGSVPHIYQRAAFPQLGDPRCIAHIRETVLCYCVKLDKDTRPIRAMFSLGNRLLSPRLMCLYFIQRRRIRIQPSRR